MRSPETEPINSWLTSCIMRTDRLPRRRRFTRANRTADMCTSKTALINTHGCSQDYAFILNHAFVNTVHDWLKGRISGDLSAFDQRSSVVDRITNIKERNEHILIIAACVLHSSVPLSGSLTVSTHQNNACLCCEEIFISKYQINMQRQLWISHLNSIKTLPSCRLCQYLWRDLRHIGSNRKMVRCLKIHACWESIL